MSVNDQLTRIKDSRDTIRTKMVSLGLSASDDTLDELATAVNGIAVKTSSNMTTSGATVTAPAGYYKTAQSKSVSTATQATPSITVSSTGLITASATQSAGYVASGTKSGTKQLTTKGATTITPSTSKQTAVASGTYTTGAIEVAAMPTATQATPSISVSSAGLITATSTQSAGYVAAGTKSATKQLSTQAAATITPGTSNKTAVAAGKYTTGAVTVKGDANLKAENIRKGVSIFGVAGAAEGGGTVEETTNEAGGKSVYINSEVPKLPSGYTRLQYIQGAGSQYINTGVKGKSGLKMRMRTEWSTLSGDSNIFGALESGNRMFVQYSGGLLYAYGSYYTSSASIAAGVPYIIEAEFSAGKQQMMVNGASVYSGTSASSYSFSANVYLLALNIAGTAGLFAQNKLYDCQIWDNGTLVRDYVPCLNARNVAGLYDLVNGVFYGDAAGGGFVAGPVVLDYTLPEGYEELEYIQSTGSQYVDTGFKPNNNTRVVMDAYNLSAESKWILGAWTSSKSLQFASSCGSGYSYRYGSTSVSLTDVPVGALHVDFNKNAYNMNGATGTVSAQTFTCEYPMYLFTINAAGSPSSGKFTGRVMSCQIQDNGVLVRYYVPCKNASGTVGLWDAVNNTFTGDAAGVGFLDGPSKGVSKVVLEDRTLIDLTQDTVSPEALLSGYTAHNAMGQLIQGAASAGKPVASGTVSANSTNVATVSGLPFKPSVVFMYYNQQSSISNNTNMSILADIEGSFYSTDRAVYDSYSMVTSYNRRGGTSYVNVVVTENGFTITLEGGRYGGSYRWYAIGSGG